MDTAVTADALPIRENGIARKEQLRAELEAVGAEYRHLLGSIGEQQWQARCAHPHWSLGAVFAHIALGLGTIPVWLWSARTGVPLALSTAVFHPLNSLLAQCLGQWSGPARVGAHFEKNHARACALLESVQETD